MMMFENTNAQRKSAERFALTTAKLKNA